MMRRLLCLACCVTSCLSSDSAEFPPLSLPAGLILDLNASKGVTRDQFDRVERWQNSVADFPARDFIQRDDGRKDPGSGRPQWVADVPGLNGQPTIRFRQQELVCLDEDAFDSLIQGGGCTWISVLAAHEQRVGLKDVNSFFGNLKNGGNYEGIWGCLNDDNTPWWGARNGLTFGRFDVNNPQLLGPKLQEPTMVLNQVDGKYSVLAGRMAAGTGKVKLEFFIDSPMPCAKGEIEVNPKANASRMAIGQERDAINHPGHESFDGEIARFLIYARPLGDEELKTAFRELKQTYGLK